MSDVQDKKWYKRTHEFTPYTKADGKAVSDEFDAIQASFERIPAMRDDGKGFAVAPIIPTPTENNHPVPYGMYLSGVNNIQENCVAVEQMKNAVQQNTQTVAQNTQNVANNTQTVLVAERNVTNKERSAVDAENMAKKWASHPENELVLADKYSAYHYAMKAKTSEIVANQSKQRAIQAEQSANDSASTATQKASEAESYMQQAKQAAFGRNNWSDITNKPQFISEENNRSKTDFATPFAVNTAYDKAVDADNNANNRVAKTGDTMTGTLYFARANETYRVGTWDWRNVIKINGDGLIGNEQTAIAFNNNGNLHLGGSRNGKWRATLQERFLETRSIVTANAGSGSYVDQYRNNDAPFFVDASGSNARDVYFPFIKGRVRSTNQYGTALSFGYVTKGGGGPDGFGAGIVHLIEGNGSNWRWEFKHGGDFRSAGDVVTSAGTSLNALNNKVTQLQPSQNLTGNGWCRLSNGILLQWGSGKGSGKQQFPIAFRTIFSAVCSQTCQGNANSDVDLFYNNTHVWGRHQTAIRYFAIGV
ncbi:hypothetical protein [Gallibacterium genomosp. 1]|uniref:hypothetical protein n=1 Tax=Gallibacterium genomosp. 1 TaxID=155515 RepID=UPI0008027870|nr:hypothetical protein [Gallibacterium genomosp. 1]